LDLPCSVNFIS